MKVIIISPCHLPIPAIKGGAVLTLIESIIQQNEINHKIDLTVVGIYDEVALKASLKYQNTNFIYLRQPKIVKYLDKAMSTIVRMLKGKAKKPNYTYLWNCYVIRKLEKLLLKTDFDKVVIQNAAYPLYAFRSKKIYKKYKGKIIYHLHNDVANRLYKKIFVECKLLLISNYLSKKIVETYGEDIKNNIKILHNGIKYERFSNELSDREKQELRNTFDISPSQKVILFAGRLDPSKGIYELLQAFQRIQDENIVLLIVGSCQFGDNIRTTFEQKIYSISKELGNRVKITGYVPYEEIWKYYKLADIAVLPSMWEEPAGLTIIEAMAAGLPVITTISGGIPEFINENYGILLKRDNKIIENIRASILVMLNDLDTWKCKGVSASYYVKDNLSEEKFYDNFIELII